jgi:D-amino-acid dehydrogenase
VHDVIVIGGGVVGAATAYLSAREGLRTLLLDRADEGRATDAGAGIISPGTSTRHETLFQLGLRSAAYYPTLLRHLAEDGGGDTGYGLCGDLRVAVSEEELEPLRSLLALLDERRRRHGRPTPDEVSEISPDDARELFPPLARPLRVLRDRTAARIDGRLLNHALLEAGARRGLTLVRGGADRLLVDGDRVDGVVAGADTHRAGRVVIAGGAWSGAFAGQLGVRLPVTPQRGQILHLRVPDARTADWPVVHAFQDQYIVAWGDGRVVAGATRETGSGFEPCLTAAGVQSVLAEALRVAPGLAGAELIEMRVGLRPMSADGLPILGPVPVAGVQLVTGHGPSGLTYGPYCARLVTDLLVGRTPELDLSPFAIERFAARPLARGTDRAGRSSPFPS